MPYCVTSVVQHCKLICSNTCWIGQNCLHQLRLGFQLSVHSEMSEWKVHIVRALAEALFPALNDDAALARAAQKEAIASLLETSADSMDFVIDAVCPCHVDRSQCSSDALRSPWYTCIFSCSESCRELIPLVDILLARCLHLMRHPRLWGFNVDASLLSL